VAFTTMGPAAARAAQPAAADVTSATVFVVRHAERADTAPGQAPPSMSPSMEAPDPVLSPAGEARAARLAALLREARIARIFTTQYARTRLTATPLANAAKVPIAAVPANDIPGLVARLSGPGGPSLVVGHSNTIPDILKALGVKESIQIADDEYDNLFVVVRNAGGSQLVKLRYE
jgi:phosphohistidine phosphatase SixA